MALLSQSLLSLFLALCLRTARSLDGVLLLTGLPPPKVGDFFGFSRHHSLSTVNLPASPSVRAPPPPCLPLRPPSFTEARPVFQPSSCAREDFLARSRRHQASTHAAVLPLRRHHLAAAASSMRSKRRAAIGATRAPPQISQNILPHKPRLCFEGETLASFLKSVHREIEAARVLDEALPPKFWIKQQFAVGVNEVTRGLERMPPYHGDEKSPDEMFGTNSDDSESRGGCFQVILVAADCNPRSLTKHLPALAASRNVPLISVRDRKEGSLRLGELIKVKTTIAIGVKVNGNTINQLIEQALSDNKTNSIEEEA